MDPLTAAEVEHREFALIWKPEIGDPLRKLPVSEIPRLPQSRVESLPRHPVRLVIENVRSAHNVGSMLRTADALLLEHVHMTGFTPGGDHRAVNKSALGAQGFVPWTHHDDPSSVLKVLKRDGYTIAAVEITDSPVDAGVLTMSSFPLALVVGNEVEGVAQESLAMCDFALELPQFGVKHSLNVSVALGVVGYDVIRRFLHVRHG